MADYSQFPFDFYTLDELGQMFIGSIKVGDREFAGALKEQIKRRKPDKEVPERPAPNTIQLDY